MKPCSSSWPQERIDEMLRMNEAGNNLREIAAALGATRNAILGKLTRMGVPRAFLPGHKRAKRAEPKLDAVAARPLRPMKPRAPLPTPEAPPLPPPVPPTEETTAPVRHEVFAAAGGVEVWQLSEQTCRWPLGDPLDRERFRYCGERVEAEKVYCGPHCRIAYVPTQRQKTGRQLSPATRLDCSVRP